jgi:hypothetical protein
MGKINTTLFTKKTGLDLFVLEIYVDDTIFGSMLAVFTDQIWPPIKLQKDEKLVNLITHAFTINQVPHVFENIIL